MKYLRIFLKVIFSACAFLMLFFSVCLMGLSGYNLVQLATSGRAPMHGVDIWAMPLVAVAVFAGSLYILAGRYPWQFFVAVSLAGCLTFSGIFLLIAGAFGISTPWAGDKTNMGSAIASYGLFLLVGIVLKYRGKWADHAGIVVSA